MTTLYIESDEGIVVKNGRKAWGVDIPAYAYDLWMPLIGKNVLATYGLLWRLARDGSTKKMGLKKLAKACGVGDKTLREETKLLERCGFIKIIEPTSLQKSMHFTMEYIILDPPTEISAAMIESFRPPGREDWTYEPLTPWLVEEKSASSDNDAGSSGDDAASSDDDASIDPSGIDPVGEKNAGTSGAVPSLTGRRVTPRREGVKTTSREEGDRKKIPFADPEMPTLGREIAKALEAWGNHKTSALSQAQVNELLSDVYVKDNPQPFPSPQQEYEAYPAAFKAFLTGLRSMPWMEHETEGKRPTPGQIIRALRGYNWRNGWFTHRPGGAPENAETERVLQDWEQYDNIYGD